MLRDLVVNMSTKMADFFFYKRVLRKKRKAVAPARMMRLLSSSQKSACRVDVSNVHTTVTKWYAHRDIISHGLDNIKTTPSV